MNPAGRSHPDGLGAAQGGQQLGIARELLGVLEREAGGAERLAGDGERGDLDDLALPAGGRASSVLRPGDVFFCREDVATVSRQHGEKGVLDCAHLGVHPDTIHQQADLGLTPH